MKGLALFEEGEYEAALTEFLAANELKSHFITLFNIATCYSMLNRPARAIDKYQECLTAGADEIDPETGGKANQEIERLKNLVGTIKILVNVEGASFVLDGEKLGDIEGRKGLFNIDPGSHTVEVMKKGYASYEMNIAASAGETISVSANLAALSMLKVDSQVPGSSVLIDNVGKGKTPFAKSIATGQYHLRVEQKGYLSYSENIKIVQGKTTHVSIDMSKIKSRQKLHQGWFWWSTVGTVASGVVAIVFGSLALDAKSEHDSTPREEFEKRVQLEEERADHALKCDVFIGLTAAFALTTIVLGIFTRFGINRSKGTINISYFNIRNSKQGFLMAF